MADSREGAVGGSRGHEQWLGQIDAELDGELSLAERAALAKHLVTCAHCAGARASQLEVRVALARAAGNPHAFIVPRPSIGAGTMMLWLIVALSAGLVGGWIAHRQWGGPGAGSLEETRGTIVVQ